jgi:hypothetical protein
MRTFEIRLSDGRTVTIQAGDSFEAVCLAIAQHGGSVQSFRRIPNS